MELKDVELKECTVADLDDVYNVQQLMIDSFKEEEKTFYLPDPKEYLEEMLNSDHHLGWLYGAYYKNKMIGFICLSISPSVKNLFAMVPDLEGNSADIDGVVVIPEYRGYGLQLHMLDFIEPIARMHNIDNLFAFLLSLFFN